MNTFAFISLLVAICCFILAIYIFRFSNAHVHKIWAFFNFAVSCWSLNLVFVAMSNSPYYAEIFWRGAYGLGSFIPITFCHFVYSFCELKKKRMLVVGYVLSLFFLIFTFLSPNFTNDLVYVFGSFYYSKATAFFNLLMLYVAIYVCFSFFTLFRYLKTAKDNKRIQTFYVFWGFGLGWGGGISTFLPHYGILVYPMWHFSICIYTFILTYASLKHNFLEIKVDLKFLLIPVTIATLALGIFVAMYFDLSLFALAGLSLGVLCLLLAFIVVVYSNQKVHHLWALFNTVVGLWGLGICLAGIAKEPITAIQSWKIAYLPCTFIAIVFYHFICAFCDFNRKKMINFAYIQGILFFPFIYFSHYFINSTVFAFDSIYYHKATTLFALWMAIFVFIAGAAFFELYTFIRTSQGIKRVQALYLFWGMALGWVGGLTTLLPPYGLNVIYPAWHFTICIYTFLMSYAIFKYQIMDIRVAVTRVGIFVLVYTLVLGIPFYSAYSLGLWKQALWLMMVLATTGPFIYLYLQKRAEEQLLMEQHQYQTTLRQASMGMGQIKDLRRLLKLIVHIVTRAVSIEHCEIYLLHEDSRQFTLKASRGWKPEGQKQVSVVPVESPLIGYLKDVKESIIYEEIEQYTEGREYERSKGVREVIKRLDGGLVVPSFMDKKLIAILVLGRKKSGKLFTDDDMVVFTILASQAGLAIENAQFYEKMKETHQQLIKAEKMATVGTMADGLSHQINNRLHAMGFIAGDVIDTIKLKKKEELAPDMRQLMDEIEHSLVRIEDNVKRGGEIVEGLLKYTRKGSEGFEAINLNVLLGAALEMVQFKIKIDAMHIDRNFDDSVPSIKGNFTQLQEVFFNLIDNAYDAMMERKEELKDPEYKANLEISAKQVNSKLEILIQDNGMGVKKENMEKLFTPFFTTKLSSKKGTGLGLYVIRQIIEENHGGKVNFTSEYQKGSQTKILLPIAL